MKQLHLLLAPKERFEPGGAGAFALNVLETSRVSRWRAGITVFGAPVAHPFSDVRFQPLTIPRWSLSGRNIAMAKRYVAEARLDPPSLIEIYNRPVMVAPIKRHLPDVPVAVHFGNDPRNMDGSRSVTDRLALLRNTAAIICVSDFIRRCFLDGIDDPLASRAHVLHTGVAWAPEFPAAKEPKIVFVGRIVADKGVLELVQALAKVLPRHPEWRADIIGARWFGNVEPSSSYEKLVARAAAECDRIRPLGFMPHDAVTAALRRASIAVVPSQWDDPFPRTALEALGAGCALLCSTRGGLREIGAERALFLDKISVDSLADALDRLITNDTERLALQRRGWEGFPFAIERTTAHLDDLRATLMGRD